MENPMPSLPSAEDEQALAESLEPPGFRRRRVRKACEPCRQRKVKCDGAKPCKVCVGYEYECYFLSSSSKKPGVTESPTVNTKPPEIKIKRKCAALEERVESKRKVYLISDEAYPSSPVTTSFTRVDSAIAFPRSLGSSLNLNVPSKLTAFAWNAGTRSEIAVPERARLFDYIALKDVDKFSKIYFDVVHPIFEVLDRPSFEQRKSHCWSSQVIDPGFEAVVCGVVSLGSLFSSSGAFAYESELVEHGRLTLDSTFAHARVLLSVDFVAGWIMRALYLRTTAKPHLSWTASNMAMHTAESIGLHQEISDVKTTSQQPRIVSEAEKELRRKIFWTAATLNRHFACQLGRTLISLHNVGCRFPASSSSDANTSFIELTRMVPLDGGTPSALSRDILVEALTKISAVSDLAPPVVLMRADMCFCIYRRLRYMNSRLSPQEVELILSIIRKALETAKLLASDRQPWWFVTGVPFHNVCILLALNTAESLSLLPEAMSTLTFIMTIFDTPDIKEAFQTVSCLLRGAEARKKNELNSIQQSLAIQSTIPTIEPQLESCELVDFPPFEWSADSDLVWFDGLGVDIFGPMVM